MLTNTNLGEKGIKDVQKQSFWELIQERQEAILKGHWG